MVVVAAAVVGVIAAQLLAPARVQLVALKVPARPVAVNATEPAGVVEPAPLVSATVAVHVEGWLMATVLGLHTMVVDVVLRFDMMEPFPAPLLELPACTASLAV